jgi:hypothetical protein
MKTYSEKLRDPKWQKKRLKILERDEFCCQLCLDTTTELQVHHLSYEKNKEPWDYDDSNFDTYCKHCHYLTELLIRDNLKILSICKLDGFISVLCIKESQKYVYFFELNYSVPSFLFFIKYSSVKSIEELLRNMKINNYLIFNKI